MVNLDDLPPQKPELGITLVKGAIAELEDNIYPQSTPYVPTEYHGGWIGLTQKTRHTFSDNPENETHGDHQSHTCNRAAAHEYQNYWPSWDDESASDYDEDKVGGRFWKFDDYETSETDHWTPHERVPVPTKDYAADQSTQWEEPHNFFMGQYNPDDYQQDENIQNDYVEPDGEESYATHRSERKHVSEHSFPDRKSKDSIRSYREQAAEEHENTSRKSGKSQDSYKQSKTPEREKSCDSLNEQRSQKSIRSRSREAYEDVRKSEDRISYSSQKSKDSNRQITVPEPDTKHEAFEEKRSQKSVRSHSREAAENMQKSQDRVSHKSQKSQESMKRPAGKSCDSFKKQESQKSIGSYVADGVQHSQDRISLKSKESNRAQTAPKKDTSQDSVKGHVEMYQKQKSGDNISKESVNTGRGFDAGIKSRESVTKKSKETIQRSQKSRESIQTQKSRPTDDQQENTYNYQEPQKPDEAPCDTIQEDYPSVHHPSAEDRSRGSLRSKHSIQKSQKSRASIQSQKSRPTEDHQENEYHYDEPQRVDEAPCETIQAEKERSQGSIKSKESIQRSQRSQASIQSQKSRPTEDHQKNIYNYDEPPKVDEAPCETIQAEEERSRGSIKSKESIQRSQSSRVSIQSQRSRPTENHQENISNYNEPQKADEAPCETIQAEKRSPGSIKSKESIQRSRRSEASIRSQKSRPTEDHHGNMYNYDEPQKADEAPCETIQAEKERSQGSIKSKESIQRSQRSQASIQSQKSRPTEDHQKNIYNYDEPPKVDEAPCETIQAEEERSRGSIKSKESIQRSQSSRVSIQSQRSRPTENHQENISNYNEPQKADEAPCDTIQAEKRSPGSIKSKESIQRSRRSEASIRSQKSRPTEDHHGNMYNYDEPQKADEAPCETIQEEERPRGSIKSKESIQRSQKSQASIHSQKSRPPEDQENIYDYDEPPKVDEAPCETIQAEERSRGSIKSKDSIQRSRRSETSIRSQKSRTTGDHHGNMYNYGEPQKTDEAPCETIQAEEERSRGLIRSRGSIKDSAACSDPIGESYSDQKHSKEKIESQASLKKSQDSVKKHSRISKDKSSGSIEKSVTQSQRHADEKSCEKDNKSIRSEKKPWDQMAEAITGKSMSRDFVEKEGQEKLDDIEENSALVSDCPQETPATSPFRSHPPRSPPPSTPLTPSASIDQLDKGEVQSGEHIVICPPQEPPRCNPPLIPSASLDQLDEGIQSDDHLVICPPQSPPVSPSGSLDQLDEGIQPDQHLEICPIEEPPRCSPPLSPSASLDTLDEGETQSDDAIAICPPEELPTQPRQTPSSSLDRLHTDAMQSDERNDSTFDAHESQENICQQDEDEETVFVPDEPPARPFPPQIPTRSQTSSSSLDRLHEDTKQSGKQKDSSSHESKENICQENEEGPGASSPGPSLQRSPPWFPPSEKQEEPKEDQITSKHTIAGMGKNELTVYIFRTICDIFWCILGP